MVPGTLPLPNRAHNFCKMRLERSIISGADNQVAPSVVSRHSYISTRWQHMLEYAPQGGSTCLSTAKMAEVQSVQDDYPVSDDYNIFSFLDEIITHTLKFLPMKSLHSCAR